MRESNDFDREELERYFTYETTCWWCLLTKEDRSQWNYGTCFHHIMGRVGKCHGSILNAAFVNNDRCHILIHGKLRKKESQLILLEHNLDFLMSQGYQLKDEDRAFLEEYADLYSEILERRKESC